MRIITGSARGTKLETPEGLNTRPTSERTKEAIFSAVQFDIERRRMLDVFSGSGQMALEALSRGAASAVAIDSDRKACEIIRRNAEKTHLADKLRILCGDALAMLGKLKGSRFSLVFMDPPYASGLVPAVLSRLAAYDLLENGAYVICETGDPGDVFGDKGELESKYSVYREYKHGIAYVTIIRPKKEEKNEDSNSTGQL